MAYLSGPPPPLGLVKTFHYTSSFFRRPPATMHIRGYCSLPLRALNRCGIRLQLCHTTHATFQSQVFTQVQSVGRVNVQKESRKLSNPIPMAAGEQWMKGRKRKERKALKKSRGLIPPSPFPLFPPPLSVRPKHFSPRTIHDSSFPHVEHREIKRVMRPFCRKGGKGVSLARCFFFAQCYHRSF